MRAVLKALSPKIQQCTESLTAQAVCNALYGLKDCSSEHAEVRAILKALSPKIQQCTEPLDAQGVGNALYGLQGCSSEHSEVRAVLKVLSPKIQRCHEPLDPQGVGNALYGMQGCYSEHAEVAAVVMSLTPELDRLSKRLGVGLLLAPSSTIAAVPAIDLCSVAQGCAALLLCATDGRPLTRPGFPTSKLEPLYDACARELDSRPIKDESSQAESRFRARAIALFSRTPRVSVRSSACYLHGFEADIVLTVVPPSDSGCTAPATVNVEVDGPTHHSRKSRLFCSVRDAHLRSRAVGVLRWDLTAKDGDSGPQFDEWLWGKLRGRLAEAVVGRVAH